MKKFVFYLILASIPFVVLEVLVRGYFAVVVGPDVFLYGTPISRYQETFDPKGASQRRNLEESSVAFHDNEVDGYTKYYPYQTRNDRDEFNSPIQVTINGRGFRGPDFDVDRKPGVVRIVTVGASSTFGFHNFDDKTYPHLLEGVLNGSLDQVAEGRTNLLGEPIRSFEVINLGIPHLRSGQILSLVLNEALELRPDYLTFYEGVNDAAWVPSDETVGERTKQTIKALPLANEIFRELRYRLLTVALVGEIISQTVDPYSSAADLEAMRAGKAEEFVSNLQRILEACEANGIRLIVASQQATGREGRREERSAVHGLSYAAEHEMIARQLATEGRVSTVEAFLMIHKELMDAQRQWAIENDVRYADVIEALDPNRDYLVSWVHLNADGNRVVAETLARTILQDLGARPLSADGSATAELSGSAGAR